MKKTSVYLDDEHVRGLRRAAEADGRSQAEVVRDAISSYLSKTCPPRTFRMAGIAEGPGGSSADIPESELLKDFGDGN